MTMNHEQLEVSRLIRASRERTYAAWTDPALIVQWWGSGEVRCTAAEMDLTVGGAYRIANQTPDGMTMWITGTFSRVEPPNRLRYTWAMEPLTPETDYSLVDVTFDAATEGTLITIVQTRIATPEVRELHLHGWIGCLEGLDVLLGNKPAHH